MSCHRGGDEKKSSHTFIHPASPSFSPAGERERVHKSSSEIYRRTEAIEEEREGKGVICVFTWYRGFPFGLFTRQNLKKNFVK